MSGWPVLKLGKACRVRRGTTITQKQTSPGDVPVVGGGIVPTYYHDTPNRPAGTITISGSGASAGYVNRYPAPIFASDCSTVETDNEHLLLQSFVFRFLQSKQDWINSKLRQGAAQPHVYASDIAEIDIPIPPLEEQRRIVAVLDEAFAAIATATANAEKNLANARELFESRVENIFSQRGEGWRDVPLGGVCDFLNGFAFKSSDAVENSRTQLVRMGNLYGRNLDLERKAAFYPDHFSSEYERFLLSEGDIIISLTGTTGKEDYGFAVKVPHSDRALLMNQRIAKFDHVNDRLVNRDYLLFFLRSRSFLNVLYPTANGTRQANLSTVTMKTILVPLCPIPMQEAIVSSLNLLSDEATRLATLYRKKLDVLGELKNAILQQAFDDTLRVSDIETIAA